MKDFGKRLKDLKIENDLTQAQLAQAIGLTTTSISKYELGKNFPQTYIIIEFAKFFAVTLDYLVGLSDY